MRVVDDFSTGKRANLPADVQVITGDVADADLMREAVKGIDGCYHLAAIASVARGLTEWVATHRTNLTGTITLFEAIARGSERPPVVYASSAAIYGDATPPTAEDAPRRPLSAYGADKAGCEFHAAVATRVHGIPTVGLRFFNVYGPRQDPSSPYSGVISIFCDRRFRGLPIDIYGDGEQTRDFIYVSDVVMALLAAMDRPNLAPIYNVCTGTPISIRHLAGVIDRLIEAYGVRFDPAIRHLPARAGDIRHSTGSPALLRRTLGLTIPAALHIGLRFTMEELRK